MKTIIPVILSVLIGLVSCKKENSGFNENENKDQTSVEKKYPVSFNLSDFKQDTENFSTQSESNNSDADLTDQIQFLTYYVYKDSVTLVKQIDQKAADPDFGTITDSLPKGKYQVFIVGSKKSGYSTFSEVYFGKYLDLYYSEIYNDFPDSIGDTFYKRLDLIVDGPSSQEVELKRIVGQLKIKINDAIPANVARIDLTFAGPQNFDLLRGTGEEGTGSGYPTLLCSRTISANERGKQNYTLCTYLWDNEFYSNFNIYYYDAQGKELGQKYLYTNIELKANRVITLSGNVFSEKSSFNVTVDSEWDEPVNFPFEEF